MKQRAKKALTLVAVFALALAMAGNVSAQPEDRELPAENDPFWDFLAVMSRPDDTTACLAEVTRLSADPNSGVDEHYSQFCTDIANMPTEMQAGMAQEGAESNLFDASNWHSVSGLYFQRADRGRIAFTETVDFLSYRFMMFMENFRNMVEFNDGFISLNASMVADMQDYGARLTMYGLDFTEQPDIYVSDGSQTRLATGDDVSGLIYDPDAGNLAFDVSHFSSYKAVSRGTRLSAMKISRVTNRKVRYNANKSTFKTRVKGRNLARRGKETTCTLGFNQAQTVRTNGNGKAITCIFSMSDFSQTGSYPLTVNVSGVGEVTKENAIRVR